MLDAHTVRFRTLTPLWTGGIDRNSDRSRETGILGPLRGWYEGIVRGMGGRVCDITAGDGSQRCRFEQKRGETFDRAYSRLCIACRLFGCTGWQRRFRLDVQGLAPQPLFFAASRGVYTASGNWLWRMFDEGRLGGTLQPAVRGPGGYSPPVFTFGAQALWGQAASLQVMPLHGNAEEAFARLAFLLDVVSRWGALGARPQHGFGQIEVTGGLDPTQVGRGRLLISEEISRDGRHPSSSPEFFNLASFFSQVYWLPNLSRYQEQLMDIGIVPPVFRGKPPFIPCAFDIRYKSQSKRRDGSGRDFGMRPWFEDRFGRGTAQRLFGRSGALAKDDRAAGRIRVSHIYLRGGHWHLKVWGHVLGNLDDSQGSPISGSQVAAEVTNFISTMFLGSQLVEEFKLEEGIGEAGNPV